MTTDESGSHEDLARLASAGPSPLADVVGTVFHPGNVVLALMLHVAVRSTDTVASAVMWWAIAALFLVAIPYTVLRLAVRRGTVDDRHVVRRDQRPALFVMAVTCVVIGLAVLWWRGAPRPLLALVIAMLAGLFAMLLVTLRYKASMHGAVSAGALAVLATQDWRLAVCLSPALLLVGWARRRSGRHTLAQVVVGVAVGSATAGTVYLALS
jgi:hypothetical protein